MSTIIDRRGNGTRNAKINRKKFLERNKKAIKRSIDDVLDNKSIEELTSESIEIKTDSTEEHSFSVVPGTGSSDRVFPGNKEFEKGDALPKPQGGQGGGSKGGDGEDGSDEFKFQISSQEFLDYFMEDLELPNLIKKELSLIESTKNRRAGFSNEGTPGQLNIIRTFKNSWKRKMVFSKKYQKEIDAIEEQLTKKNTKEELQDLKEALLFLRKKLANITFLEDLDLKFNFTERVPDVRFKAVMFCLLDVSASMTQEMKTQSKRFFMLLYIFLRRHYKDIEIRFVCHTTTAEEVDEQEFFYSQKNGGTCVSSGIELVDKIVKEEYNDTSCNIYVAQASDGDNFDHDNEDLASAMSKLLPKTQYFAYLEFKESYMSFYNNGEDTSLMGVYKTLQGAHKQLQTARVRADQPKEIWPVFKKLFKKGG